ncbi:MAG: hypothetical protein QXO75_08595 [Nitrososphaerota archaeon]
MNLTRNVTLLMVVILVTVSSAYAANIVFTAVANTGSEGPPVNWGACLGKRPPPREWQGNMTYNVTITDSQAKTIVKDALKEFTVGEVSDRGAVWIVSINYMDKPVTIIPLGKINTPTSQDALKAVQDSIDKGWSAGETKQHGFIYNVPIIDSNGNIICNIRVDGRTGEIPTGFKPTFK